MSHRKISRLLCASRCENPWRGGRSPRGAKAQGLRYEAAIGWELGERAEHNPWFIFHDANGKGHCAPDYLLPLPDDNIAIIESKYTWVPEAHTQLQQLYKPVVEIALGKRAICLVVCRTLPPSMPSHLQVCSNLAQAIIIAQSGATPIWHNLAVALRPRKRPHARRGAIAFAEAMAAL